MMKQANNFNEVLVNCDNQVIVRYLLEKYISYEIKQKILKEFNHHVIEYNKNKRINS